MSAPEFELRPYTIAIDDAVLASIEQRVRHYRWEQLPEIPGWRAGADTDFLRALCDHWIGAYDWRAQEVMLNRLPQFTAVIDGIRIRFYHLRGSNGGNRPALLLCHGWPGSAFEFLDLIEPLAHPERFGGDAADGCDVIVPCLPGYGFSARPNKPIGPRAIGKLFAKLMKEALGYRRYVVQGGDWGAAIAAWIGYDDALARGGRCCGIHLNTVLVQPSLPPQDEETLAWLQRARAAQQLEGGYSRQQGTRPQTLAIGLADSPVGMLAWIVEKFAVWSDIRPDANGDIDRDAGLRQLYGFDKLLTNAMFYIATGSFATSLWLYYAFFQFERSRTFPPGERCETPTAIAEFPEPAFPPPPRARVEQGYNVRRYTVMPHGGHFAALENPQALLADIRAFLREL
jgi:microsomal epoxide hydrolase